MVHLKSQFMSKLDLYYRLLNIFQSKGGGMGLRLLDCPTEGIQSLLMFFLCMFVLNLQDKMFVSDHLKNVC